MALVRCEEPGCGDWHHPELKAADGTPRCLRHRPAPVTEEAAPFERLRESAFELGKAFGKKD